ncbi:transporter substrate-binding domain-containing protein [Agrobacterium vitis]|uniref:transporter substrate-binding domain-containing protein n=1 Tax=Agrobacterium vitis TaxID=373 RepID=UPI0012E86E31|nr:transporter substrate-binding domain-containing protein [Agrobacterium vitis]MVA22047.1 transporter substrate-binding domain-containing protein [Agrobacterium vitis]
MSLTVNRRRFMTLAAGAAAVPLLAPAFTETAWAQSVEDLKSRGTLRIGVLSELPPWGFLDETGKPAGYDVDVGNLLATKMGVPVEFVGMTVAARIAQLMTGKVDVLLATMGMYPDRAKVVQFSKPYASLDIILLAKKATKIEKIEDAKTLRIAVTRGAAQDTAITKALGEGADIKRYDDDSAAIQAFIAGQVDALGANTTYMININKIFPNNDFEQKLSFNRQFMGIAMKPGNKELNTFLNSFIDEIKANGELEAINKKWIGIPLVQFPEKLEGVPFTVE